MKEYPKYKISLDSQVIRSFRDAINREEHFSIRARFSERAKKYRGLPAWDFICAATDRIDDTASYLNRLELGLRCRTGRAAFDFYEFVSNSAMMIDCVRMLAEVFNTDLSSIDQSRHIFNQLGKTGQGNDRKYFEYLRSLCVIHPVDTDRHSEYREGFAEVCPYVFWNNEITSIGREGELWAHIYTGDPDGWPKTIDIKIGEVFDFVSSRYQMLKLVTEDVIKYQDNEIEYFRSKEIAKKQECESESDFVERLKSEQSDRFGDFSDYVFDFAKEFLRFTPSDPRNIEAVECYKAAWRYALNIELNAMRAMTHRGREHCGFDDDETGATLLCELHYPHCRSKEMGLYNYQLEKMHYLNPFHPGDTQWGYIQFRSARPFLEKYMAFNDDDDMFETYCLINTALYLHALENPGYVNEGIPMSSKFRPNLCN